MKRWIGCLLILLLLGAALDDGWAAATPDPVDDALAARNDAYLPSAAPRTRKGENNAEPLRPSALPSPAHPFAALGAALQPGPRAASGPPLVYVLMTLRR